MVLESAEIMVRPGMEQEFENGVKLAAPLFRRAAGCMSFELLRTVENPQVYRLSVQWKTMEDHTVHFRSSDDFQAWRRLVGQCFDGAPVVTHLTPVLVAF